MKYQIHLKSLAKPHTAAALIEHLDILRYLRGKNFKAQIFTDRPVIEFESSNPGIINHLKKKFPNHIVGVFSEKHGAGRYKRPRFHKGLFGPSAVPLTPAQVAKAYNFPSADQNKLKDQVVAIIELGGGYNPADVYAYCKAQGVAPPRLYGHNVETGSNAPEGPEGADGEVCLDVDVVAAVAPGIKILVIFAPNTTQGFLDAIYAASNYPPLQPKVLSISWGAPENDYDTASMEAINNAIQTCVQKGINVFVAAGDDGSSDGGVGNNVDFPSSSPYSLSCGGTKLILNKDGTRHSEVVWNDMLTGEGATGGGVSVSGRKVPDIAGNADPNSGYVVDVDGQTSAIGGTSAVAPLMAGLNALLNANLGKPVSNLKEILYANPNVCFDVTSGNNGSYSASAGYDLCTGLGVPDGQKIMAVLKPAPHKKLLEFLKQPVGKLFS